MAVAPPLRRGRPTIPGRLESHSRTPRLRRGHLGRSSFSLYDGGRRAWPPSFFTEGTLLGKTQAKVVAMFGEAPWRLPDWDMAYCV